MGHHSIYFITDHLEEAYNECNVQWIIPKKLFSSKNRTWILVRSWRDFDKNLVLRKGMFDENCWFYAFYLIDVIQQAGDGPAKHQDLATCCQLVRGQVYIGGVVYKCYVILYDHLSCILCIRQYTDYCIPCCQTRQEEGFKPKNNKNKFEKTYLFKMY